MDAINPIRKQRADWVAGALWCAVILLIVIGVVASTGRTMFPGDFGVSIDPIRTTAFHALNRLDPAALQREQEVRLIDAKFGAHRLATWMHVIPGAIFLLFAPMQFSSRLRGRYLRFHRWSGRLLVVTAFAAVLPGFYFGLLMPYGGVGESVVIALGGGHLPGCTGESGPLHPASRCGPPSRVDDSRLRHGSRRLDHPAGGGDPRSRIDALGLCAEGSVCGRSVDGVGSHARHGRGVDPADPSPSRSDAERMITPAVGLCSRQHFALLPHRSRHFAARQFTTAVKPGAEGFRRSSAMTKWPSRVTS